ncbi:MAG TPA: hypothetical protein VFS17_08515 [Methylophilaceae bacterium]|nr:hypothetical protein [Methylophilaceae bacterium]
MKHLLFVCLSALALTLPAVGQADDSFKGKVESRPADKVGEWVIDGRKLDVTAAAELEEKAGPMVAGACVEVEMDDGIVEEIETVDMDKCQ